MLLVAPQEHRGATFVFTINPMLTVPMSVAVV